VELGCEALQIFTKNASQWRASPLDRAQVRLFRDGLDATGLTRTVSHASYLINLASAHAGLRAQSIAAFIDELERADALGLYGVVVHPGACTSGSTEDALRLVAEAINIALRARRGRRSLVILEHTAGQGRTVGHTFEQLAAIIRQVGPAKRVGVCLDTCHLVAAGYDIATEAGYRDTFEMFGRIVGFDRLQVVHANDSKRPCGSRVDRHEHIGRGCLGEEPFRRLLHDRRFAGLPLLIETAKSHGRQAPAGIEPDPFDVQNLDVLRRLRGETRSGAITVGAGVQAGPAQP
jgi:deoxyribonuclease-4